MARGSIPITSLVTNAGTIAAGSAIDTANGMYINAGGDTSGLVIRITNTAGTVGTVRFVPGTNPPAFRAGLGTVELTVPATTGEVMVVLESARVAQSGGEIYIDFVTGMTGVVSAYRLPNDN